MWNEHDADLEPKTVDFLNREIETINNTLSTCGAHKDASAHFLTVCSYVVDVFNARDNGIITDEMLRYLLYLKRSYKEGSDPRAVFTFMDAVDAWKSMAHDVDNPAQRLSENVTYMTYAVNQYEILLRLMVAVCKRALVQFRKLVSPDNGWTLGNILCDDYPTVNDRDENGNRNCVNCTNCTNCDGCRNCDGCNDCKNCVQCADCRECKDCKKCISCKECRSCKDCKDCKDCSSCVDCYHCDDCYNCIDCVHSSELDHCDHCAECEECCSLPGGVGLMFERGNNDRK